MEIPLNNKTFHGKNPVLRTAGLHKFDATLIRMATKLEIPATTATIFNELNCQLTGPRESTVALIEFEAEIYDVKSESKTLELAVELIKLCLPSCPDGILESFESGKATQLPNWNVEKTPNDAGYETRLTHRPPGARNTKTVKKRKSSEKKTEIRR